ncbi:MAG: response regulator, partial [Deltaproteobacteria bacterium]|nr:response regulator [Deltaproteobacteria bacterium]
VDLGGRRIIKKKKNGLQLTDLIKQNYDIEIIVMTGYSENYSYEDAINKGASDLVFKPFRFEELMLRLKRVLKELTVPTVTDIHLHFYFWISTTSRRTTIHMVTLKGTRCW